MAGITCFVCGLDYRSGKLVQHQAYDERGNLTNVSVHDECKAMMIQGNHPENQNLSSESPSMPGFVKPSNPENPYPPVRPS